MGSGFGQKLSRSLPHHLADAWPRWVRSKNDLSLSRLPSKFCFRISPGAFSEFPESSRSTEVREKAAKTTRPKFKVAGEAKERRHHRIRFVSSGYENRGKGQTANKTEDAHLRILNPGGGWNICMNNAIVFLLQEKINILFPLDLFFRSSSRIFATKTKTISPVFPPPSCPQSTTWTEYEAARVRHSTGRKGSRVSGGLGPFATWRKKSLKREEKASLNSSI